MKRLEAFLRRHIGLIHLAAFVGLWLIVQPDLSADWPVMLLGVAVPAVPVLLALAWFAYGPGRKTR